MNEGAVPEFRAFPKIPRFAKEIVITEKIDGTNAQVFVGEDGTIRAGSRRRWITPEEDNFGFAAWVRENADELRELGPGRHFGEWWGHKIQRGYGLTERRFSLFNVDRETVPMCCYVVPVLYRGEFYTTAIEGAMHRLERLGSRAEPGFDNPEGVIVCHASGAKFKQTFNDEHKEAAWG